jgi:hypothetical protein
MMQLPLASCFICHKYWREGIATSLFAVRGNIPSEMLARIRQRILLKPVLVGNRFGLKRTGRIEYGGTPTLPCHSPLASGTELPYQF